MATYTKQTIKVGTGKFDTIQGTVVEVLSKHNEGSGNWTLEVLVKRD